ncbi:MAG: ABC transporter ATP-binding protein [Spirochaetaceae bacterium]|jgi:NitT/TauT family transport system ATP-binding protein|nr:ABC transporter ATP-binding protein [Spirochaetaceae bacterium]
MVELSELAIDYLLPRRLSVSDPSGPCSVPPRLYSVPALAPFTARFERGKISTVIGPSGCGKTSLIHAIAGLLKPSSGRICIDGKAQQGIRKNTGVIFQHFGLLPWKTVEANVELPLKIMKAKKNERRERSKKLLGEFGLEEFRRLYPHKLSGGMKQRLAIARALISEPDLLLMDEPFSSLDALSREEAQDFLLSIKESHRLTIILITHSIEEAVYLSDTVYVITGKNPGKLTARIDLPRTGRDDSRFPELAGKLRNFFGA